MTVTDVVHPAATARDDTLNLLSFIDLSWLVPVYRCKKWSISKWVHLSIHLYIHYVGFFTCSGANHSSHSLATLHQFQHWVDVTLPVLLNVFHLNTSERVRTESLQKPSDVRMYSSVKNNLFVMVTRPLILHRTTESSSFAFDQKKVMLCFHTSSHNCLSSCSDGLGSMVAKYCMPSNRHVQVVFCFRVSLYQAGWCSHWSSWAFAADTRTQPAVSVPRNIIWVMQNRR